MICRFHRLTENDQMLGNGRLHRVKCHWCGLKMACNCWLDEEKAHIIILCPKCQVAEFTNLLFGRESQSIEMTMEPVEPAPR